MARGDGVRTTLVIAASVLALPGSCLINETAHGKAGSLYRDHALLTPSTFSGEEVVRAELVHPTVTN